MIEKKVRRPAKHQLILSKRKLKDLADFTLCILLDCPNSRYTVQSGAKRILDQLNSSAFLIYLRHC